MATGRSWGKCLLDGIRTLERKRGFILRRRYRLPLFGVFALLLTLVIPYLFPQWYVYITQFLWANLLFTGAILLALLFLLLWKLPQQQVTDVLSVKDRVDLESKSRQTLAQIVGGAALLGGLYFTAQTLRTSQETLKINQETLRTTQQGQITERFTKAIEHLGDTQRLMVRLGGIHALERIAKDSEYDYWAVMEVLTAFVREQASAQKTILEEPLEKKMQSQGLEMSKVPADIQAILTVLGRRTRTYGKGESQRLDLSRSPLQGATLAGANLQGAFLWGTNLQGATLWGANLQGADLWGANLTKAINLTQDQINVACGNERTELSVGLTKPAPCPSRQP